MAYTTLIDNLGRNSRITEMMKTFEELKQEADLEAQARKKNDTIDIFTAGNAGLVFNRRNSSPIK